MLELAAQEIGKKVMESNLSRLAKEIPNLNTNIADLDKSMVKELAKSKGIEGKSDILENEYGTEKIGLSEEEKVKIKEETGWSNEIVDAIENMDQYEIYKNADLHEAEINGRKCLVKDIDLDYVDPDTGMTNRERMEKGRAPIDAKTGEKIELHHMGQNFDGPFAELDENSEHGDGNHKVLHTRTENSWRNNLEQKNQYQTEKRVHWQSRY